MTLLLNEGSRTDIGTSFHDLLDDFGRDNILVTLVGVREYPVKPYKRFLKKHKITLPDEFSPLEYCLLFSFNDVKQNKISGPIFYIELHPFKISPPLFSDNAIVNFKRYHNYFYGTIEPDKSAIINESEDKCFLISKKFLFPFMSEDPFHSNYISKKDLEQLFDPCLDILEELPKELNSLQEENYLVHLWKYLETSNYRAYMKSTNAMLSKIHEIFSSEDLRIYKPIDSSNVQEGDKECPLLSSESFVGKNPIEMQYASFFSNLLAYMGATKQELQERIRPEVYKRHETFVDSIRYASIVSGITGGVYGSYAIAVPSLLLLIGLTVNQFGRDLAYSEKSVKRQITRGFYVPSLTGRIREG